MIKIKLLPALLTSVIALGCLSSGHPAKAEDNITAGFVNADLSNPVGNEGFWKTAKAQPVSLMAQPMIIPRPLATETSLVNVQAVHNGKNIAFRLKWKDPEKSEGGPLGTYSDGVAIQFPVKLVDGAPPLAFMGEAGNPVHIYHWKDAFQYDKDNKRMKTVKDIYPNMSIDMHSPVEPKAETRDHIMGVTENYPRATEEQKMVYVPGQAAGNPQSFPKDRAIDEIFAEGWATSQVIDNHEGIGNGKWENGEWTVIISRPLKSKTGSVLEAGKTSYTCFAVWQGGKGEVGARKSLTLNWIPLNLAKNQEELWKR